MNVLTFGANIFMQIKNSKEKFNLQFLTEQYNFGLKTGIFKRYWEYVRYLKLKYQSLITLDLAEYSAGKAINSSNTYYAYVNSISRRVGKVVDNRKDPQRYFTIQNKLHGYNFTMQKYFLNNFINHVNSLRYL
jgi:hypothetical protein